MEAPDQAPLKLRPDLAEIPALAAYIESYAAANSLSMADEHCVSLAAEELFVNTVSYGGSSPKEASVELMLSVVGDLLTISYSDAGVPFDPTGPAVKPPPEQSVPAVDRPIGGLGVHFIKNMMESVRYERRAERNILTMTRRLGTGHLVTAQD